MKSFSITDIGMKRKVNQDYVFRTESNIGNLPNLFLVADGMGGHKAGDYASKFCVEKVAGLVGECRLKTPIGILEKAITTTNEELFQKAQEKRELQGMGTTMVAATILDRDLYVANIGDSRLYVISDAIRQITEDHSLVEVMIRTGELKREQARFHPNKNIITRALGGGKQVIPDYFEVQLKRGDLVLMCTDGLSNMLDDEEMKKIIKQYENNLEIAAKNLVKQANEAGGKDNIGLILIRS